MKNLLRISTFLKPYAGQVIASLVMLLTLTGLNLLVPRIIQSVIDDGLVHLPVRDPAGDESGRRGGADRR